MTIPFVTPPQVAWASGIFSAGSLRCKSTTVADLADVFADADAWQKEAHERVVYNVEMLESPYGEGELYVGATHLSAGLIGDEFFMTRGHFHQRREQGEVYFGLCGEGLLLLQSEQGEAWLETVQSGSVHIIPAFTAHRLINTGQNVLSALAVWPSVAGHDYHSLAQGFALRVFSAAGGIEVREVRVD